MVSTFAGTGQGFENGAAATAKFNSPYGVAVATNGDVYVADTGNHAIRRITAQGVVSTFAGGVEGFVNATGTNARLRSPFSLTCDGFGNVYVADAGNHALRMITADGTTSTIGGNGKGFVDGLFSAAKFSVPNDVALDLSGQLIVADFNNHAIRRADRSTLQVATMSGNGSEGLADGGKSVARMRYPTGIATDGTGRVYIADNQNHRIRVLSADGTLTTLAGSEKGAQDGALNQARFNEPTDLVVVGDAIFVADTANFTIRKIRMPAGTL